MFALYFVENLIAWRSKRRRRRKAKSRRRRAKENTRKSMKVATTLVTPLVVAAVVIVAQIQTAGASSRARRVRRTRKKIPVGITARRASSKSRVRKGPPLTGAGQQALTPDRSGLKRSRQIIDTQGQRGEGAGARRTEWNWREVKRERDTAAGTGRNQAAPSPVWTEVGAAREAGRTEVKTGVTAETGRRTEAAQMEGEAEQQMGGVEAGSGGRTGRAEEGAGVEVGAERGEREVKTEQRGGADRPFFLFTILNQTQKKNICSLCLRWLFSPVPHF